MKKILIFSGYFYPSKNSGGPQTSLLNVIKSCNDIFDFKVVCYNHDFNSREQYKEVKNGFNPTVNVDILYIDHSYDYNYKKMYELIRSEKTSLVWFSGVLTPAMKLVAISACKKMNIPILFSPRGELSPDRVKIKGYKKLPYLLLLRIFGVYKNSYFHYTSKDELIGIKKYLNIPNERLYFSPNVSVVNTTFKSIDKDKGFLSVIFISRIHHIKNLLFAIKIINSIKDININLDIYGPIESQKYWDDCNLEIQKSPANITIKYLGTSKPSETRLLYEKYHCFVFPTLNENYGHVIAESLSYGCPVILSKNTTPWDDIDNKAGYVCDLNKSEDFVNALRIIGEMHQAEYNFLRENTFDFFNEWIIENDAIGKHKSMFKDIIKEIEVT